LHAPGKRGLPAYARDACFTGKQAKATDAVAAGHWIARVQPCGFFGREQNGSERPRARRQHIVELHVQLLPTCGSGPYVVPRRLACCSVAHAEFELSKMDVRVLPSSVQGTLSHYVPQPQWGLRQVRSVAPTVHEAALYRNAKQTAPSSTLGGAARTGPPGLRSGTRRAATLSWSLGPKLAGQHRSWGHPGWQGTWPATVASSDSGSPLSRASLPATG
jgi:hypothetical protein